MSRRAWQASFVTAVELLHAAIDALEHDPHNDGRRAERKHPDDAYTDAWFALRNVTGERLAETERARGR